MNLTEILSMPDGFTPPDVTVKIEKVYEYKSGESDRGPWSFQDIVVTGGRLKLKGLPEFPKDREGMTVTIKAHSSAQHGLTGLKVAHEEYNDNVYDKLVVTKSAKWEFANPAGGITTNGNGTAKKDLTYTAPMDNVEPYIAHLLGCAGLAIQVSGELKIADDAALQACFATICIDTKNRGILLPKPNGVTPKPKKVEPEPEEEEGEEIPF